MKSGKPWVDAFTADEVLSEYVMDGVMSRTQYLRPIGMAKGSLYGSDLELTKPFSDLRASVASV